MGERFVGYDLPGLADRGDSALQVDRVLEHDGGDHEVQPTGAMPLVLPKTPPIIGVTLKTSLLPALKL